MGNFRLGLIVFLCGAVVMIYELVGTRVLAPYIGTSTYVWTSLIGVILGSLSLGYWLGGRFADRQLGDEFFAVIIFFAASIIGITNFFRDSVLSIIEMQIYDIRWGSLLASLIIFAPASVLLGMVSPYAVKLRSKVFEEIGTTVGSLYAYSTVGSIFGTFLAGFYLIPHYGTSAILVFISLTLTCVSIIALPMRSFLKKLVMLLYSFIIIGVGDYLNKKYNGPFPLADLDTEYNRIQIIDDTYRENVFGRKRDVRVMRIGNVINSGIYLDDDALLLNYTNYFRLVSHFFPSVRDSLMIGGGAFIYPRNFLNQFPNANMDVVEIDSRMSKIARDFFGFSEEQRLRIINQDGRTFLNRTHNQYDVIFCDAFSSTFIPYQLTTRNSIVQMHRVLRDNGVVLVNILSSIEGGDGKFLRAEYATFKSVFPQVYLFPVKSADDGKLFQNIMLIAIKGEQRYEMHSADPEIDSYLSHFWKHEVKRDVPILSDDYAPVEHYIGLHSRI